MKDLYLHRIITGQVDFNISKEKLFLDRFSRDSKYRAEQIYEDMIYELSFSDLMNDNQVKKMLIDNGMWSKEKDLEIEDLTRGIDLIKMKLIEALFRKEEREAYRQQLHIAKDRYNTLFIERHSFDHLTSKGVATLAKTNYLICSNLKDNKNNLIWKNDSFINEPISFLVDLVEQYNSKRINEKTLREIARTEPWRSMWVLGKKEGSLFGIPAVDYTDDQKYLCIWSSIYDSVYESQDCPPDFVIEDDDLLDGWLLCQRQKREDSVYQRKGEELVSGKLSEAEEVYFVAGTEEEAQYIDRFNTPEAKKIKAERMKYLQEQGEVREQDMPDQRKKYREQVMEAYKKFVKGE